MRITKLSIEKYKNLENFSWELNPDYPVAVIVGKNGSGKTNLLEAIITIFQDLQLYDDENARKILLHFKFEIEYLHGDDTINIKKDETLKITKNGGNVPLSQLENFRQDVSRGEDVLPKTIFVYYAGNTTRLEDLANKSISEYEQTLIHIATNKVEMQSSPKQPLFYYDLIHHRAVFLTLMLSRLEDYNEETKEDFLKSDLNIEKLISVELTISRPEWKSSSADWKRISRDTESFWDAPTYLQFVLEFLRETTISEDKKTPKESSLEILDKDSKIRFNLWGNEFREKFANTSNQQDFFQQLSNLILAKYLTDIRIYFKKEGVETPLEFNDLSEGEWQRIGIRGAMELFQGEETLFLLDEPDTFAHPRWQWEFVPDINETVGKNEENKNAQVIFITHSPLVLSSTEKNAFFMEGGQIHLLHENFAQDANMSLAKMGVNPQFEMFGDDFKNYFELIKNGQGESEFGLAERARLEEIYGLNHEKFDTADIMISFYR